MQGFVYPLATSTGRQTVDDSAAAPDPGSASAVSTIDSASLIEEQSSLRILAARAAAKLKNYALFPGGL